MPAFACKNIQYLDLFKMKSIYKPKNSHKQAHCKNISCNFYYVKSLLYLDVFFIQ